MISNETKIIITGFEDINKFNLAKQLTIKDKSLSVCPILTTDGNLENTYIIYTDPKVLNLNYKNNAMLFVNTKNYKTTGITVEDFNKNNIIITTLEEFNNISDKFFTSHDILIIWLDNKNSADNVKYKYELKYLNDRLNIYPYMYFLSDEHIEYISNTIIKYINGTEEDKKILRNENN